jgi:hypothetical protein
MLRRGCCRVLGGAPRLAFKQQVQPERTSPLEYERQATTEAISLDIHDKNSKMAETESKI